ncbi:uracil phosphoribosyltransferase [Deinococcus radiophilus]|uniref:Uracil phosphoribosyltransferase n=1 Tax=Deinococcus radiophilus TaxID=32062 RepID=A0A3S0KKF2_9DEIO|nr:uracil phosphoribosyltransferase [Deinococcus radiophilus]RTR28669.1 uracil phosphoribosyltransferase [Deinococcus radiophilus]UFA51092.1 uracil phosphoribosyltransferase [Deinococcus radiophilus]
MLTVVEHPLIQHKLSLMRDERTGVKEFRELAGELSLLLAYEAMRDLELVPVRFATPVQEGDFPMLSGKKLALVAILRAGLVMTEAMTDLIPAAKVGHIGMYRDPETLQPVAYYSKLPEDIGSRRVFLTDPMLATGGSAVAAIDKLKEVGAERITLMCILAAPEGIEVIRQAHPDVDIVTAAVDERLNDHGYIVPGLGDAGDRIYGTK